jgi:hypothetical protein
VPFLDPPEAPGFPRNFPKNPLGIRSAIKRPPKNDPKTAQKHVFELFLAVFELFLAVFSCF